MNRRIEQEMVAATRQQTPEEERQFVAALDLLVAELVRHQPLRNRSECEESKSTRKAIHQPRSL